MKLFKNMLKIAVIVNGILYFHKDMNLLVSHVDSMYINENTNLVKYKEKKYILLID